MLSKILPQLDGIAIKILPNTAVIQFNRPEERNPLKIEVLKYLNSILEEFGNDKTIRNIVFTGKEDVFASGADLREIALVNEKTAREFALCGQNLMQKICDSDKMTIAAVNGYCFGGGLDLALSCDKRIASPKAVFCHPGANLGIITGWGGTQRLPRLIGQAKALEMFLTAKRVGAYEAFEMGLIDEIVDNSLDFSLANYC